MRKKSSTAREGKRGSQLTIAWRKGKGEVTRGLPANRRVKATVVNSRGRRKTPVKNWAIKKIKLQGDVAKGV